MYLDFKEISKIPFKNVLDYLGIVYTDCRDGLKGIVNDTPFVVTPDKNLFFCPHMKDWRGGIINFVSIHRGTTLVDAAKELKEQFIEQHKDPKRPIPDLKLEYCAELRMGGIGKDTAERLEIGMCRSRSIMANKLCFKMYDGTGENCVGYVFLERNSSKFLVPKGYKHDYLFNYHRIDNQLAIVAPDPWTAAKIHSMGIMDVIGLTHPSVTEAQVALLKKFNCLMLVDPEPAVIIRLSQACYVRSCLIENLEALKITM